MANSPTATLLRLIWSTKLYRLCLITMFAGFGLSVLSPVMPPLLANYFASQSAGRRLTCSDYRARNMPRACRTAFPTVAMWNAWTNFVQDSVLSLLFSPLIGHWSDRLGRKPFFLIYFCLWLPANIVVVTYQFTSVSLKWYFFLLALTGLVSPFFLLPTYVADLLPDAHRSGGLGILVATFSVGVLVGPLAGGFMGAKVAALTSISILVSFMSAFWLFVPESLSQEKMKMARGRREKGGSVMTWVVGGMKHFWQLLRRSSRIRRLVAIMGVLGFVGIEPTRPLISQYLQLTLGFKSRDLGLVQTSGGLVGLLTQAVVLPLLVHVLGEKTLLVFGLLAYMSEHIVLTLVKAGWMAYLADILANIGVIAWPCAAAMVANSVAPDEQGAAQGALIAVRSLSSGVGPLVLSRIFRESTVPDSSWGYKPWAVFVGPAVLSFLAALLALTIRPQKPVEVIFVPDTADKQNQGESDVEGQQVSAGATKGCAVQLEVSDTQAMDTEKCSEGVKEVEGNKREMLGSGDSAFQGNLSGRAVSSGPIAEMPGAK